MFREPKRGVSDYHQRRMFAHGYHFIAEQVTLPTNTETEKETNTQTDRQEKKANTMIFHRNCIFRSES